MTDKIACKGLMPPFQIDVDRRPVTICPHFSPHPPLQLGMQLHTVLRDRHNTDEQVPPPSNDVDGDSASKLDKTMLRDLDFRSKGPAVYRLSFELRTFDLTALVRKMVVQSPASQAIIQNEGGTNEVPSLKPRWWFQRSLL